MVMVIEIEIKSLCCIDDADSENLRENTWVGLRADVRQFDFTVCVCTFAITSLQ